jgi:hypothetical protein
MITAALTLVAAQAAAFDNGRLLPIAQGQWTYVQDAAGSGASFGGQFAVRCTRATRLVTLTRLMPVAPPAGTTMQIITDTKTMTYSSPNVSLHASDTGLDSLAYTRGRFVVAVSGSGGGSLALPIGPEVARSIEDCRN